MKTIMRFMTAVTVTAAIALGTAGCVKAQGFFGNPVIGKQAPNFILETVKGNKFVLDEAIKGKKAIVFFWATWCPHCREQITALSEKRSALEKDGVVVLLVDIGEPANTVKKFTQAYKIDYEVILDPEGYASGMYDVMGIPQLFFISEDGKVRNSLHGFPDDYMELFK